MRTTESAQRVSTICVSGWVNPQSGWLRESPLAKAGGRLGVRRLDSALEGRDLSCLRSKGPTSRRTPNYFCRLLRMLIRHLVTCHLSPSPVCAVALLVSEVDNKLRRMQELPPGLRISEEEARKRSLLEDFRKEIGRERRLGRLERFLSGKLLFLAITASGVAGIAGLTNLLSARWVGGIALLPNLLLLYARSFKLEERASWHYRKKNRLEDLRDQILYQMPENPTWDQLAPINKKKHGLNKEMQDEWDTRLSLNWSNIERHHQREPPKELK